MAFHLDDFKSYTAYKNKLRSEAGKVGTSGYFAFMKCKFPEGTKSVLIVGAKKDKDLEDALMDEGGKLVASGSCRHTNDGLLLSAKHGKVTPNDVHGLGIDVAFEESETEEPQLRYDQIPGLEQEGEGGQTNQGTQPTGFQRAKKPTQTRQQPEQTLGGGTREAIAQFVKQRQELLAYSRSYLENMKYFEERATALVVQVNGLIARTDNGERSENLTRALEAALPNVQELRQAAKSAYEEQGQHVARERQVNPSRFGLQGETEALVARKYQSIFKEVTSLTQQAGVCIRKIQLELDEAIRGLELSLSFARTGKADLTALLGYLDGVLAALDRPTGTVRDNANMENFVNTFRQTVNNQQIAPQQLEEAMAGQRHALDSRAAFLTEAYEQVQHLCKTGLARLKQGPQENQGIKERFNRFKTALSDATMNKRTFDTKSKEFEALEEEAKARLQGERGT
jgi:hypothetical protein